MRKGVVKDDGGGTFALQWSLTSGNPMHIAAKFQDTPEGPSVQHLAQFNSLGYININIDSRKLPNAEFQFGFINILNSSSREFYYQGRRPSQMPGQTEEIFRRRLSYTRDAPILDGHPRGQSFWYDSPIKVSRSGEHHINFVDHPLAIGPVRDDANNPLVLMDGWDRFSLYFVMVDPDGDPEVLTSIAWRVRWLGWSPETLPPSVHSSGTVQFFEDDQDQEILRNLDFTARASNTAPTESWSDA